MKKLGVVLALLVLVSALTVGTGTVRKVKADATTQYFIIVENATESYINTTLSGVTWEHATPQYTVRGNVIYFPNLQNMTRFLTPPDFKNNFVFPLDKIETSVPLTIVWFYGWDGSKSNADIYFTVNSTDDQTPFAWARIRWDSGAYPIKYYFYVNDNLVFTSSSGTVRYYSQNIAVAPGDQLHFKKSDPYSGSGGSLYSGVFLFFEGDVSGTFSASGTNKDYGIHTFETGVRTVTFHLTDALTGQPLTGVTVKDTDSTVLGTVDDGGSLELARGQHTLTFEKTGYWSVTKTIDVQGDMSVSVELYPSSAAFKLENFPSEITIPEHTVYTLTFTISPINTDATYNAYLSLSGLSDVLEVRKDGSVISPENGRYYLGDISGPTQISIKFKATSVGTYAFSLTLESHDAFGTKTYTTTKQVKYKVDPLPFTVEMPSEWQVGDNQLRISEASGQSYAMVIVLKDQAGSQVWSDSYAFNPYDVHTFTVNVPKEGTYTLEFQWNGQTASYTINVGTGISLLTKSVSVKKGGVGTVQVQLKNPSDSTKYYTIRLEGGFLDVPVNQTVAIAPSSTKTVSIAFAVPENVQFDAYDLTLKVLEGDAVRYSDTVHVIITGSEAGLPIALGGGGGSTLLIVGAAAAALGLGAVLVMRRR